MLKLFKCIAIDRFSEKLGKHSHFKSEIILKLRDYFNLSQDL